MGQASQRRMWALTAVVTLLFAACTGDDDSDDGGGQDRADPADDPITALTLTGAADPSCQAEGDGVLRLGGLLSETGEQNALLGRPQALGASLAVADVNAAGGVLGQEVAWEQLDPGEDSAQLDQQLETHVQNQVDAVVGASTAQGSAEIVQQITSSCTVAISPSTSGGSFTTVDDGDLFFRTAASDVLQGRALAQAALAQDLTQAAILNRDDDYSADLSRFVREGYLEGGGRLVIDEDYDPETSNHEELAQQVMAAQPQALFLVGREESAEMLAALVEAGFDPSTQPVFLVEASMSGAFAVEAVPADAPGGVRGTIPGNPPEALRVRMLDQVPDLGTVRYGGEAYDAVVVLALAAHAAGTDQADALAREVNGVTRDGTECSSFEQCRDMLELGQDINYQGQSGPLDFARSGEPSAARFALVPWTDQETIELLDAQTVDVVVPPS